ncbi:STAS domain-containing protein [Pulveribacter suum]|uniref:MlaB-like STAS domain-containing protein n=1 Tax=Pulveribacter suum TaxID=2116657 RepID=A0A2P1NIS1_9BURK|nr:STAS domain-containing protein [Pulveribacter suum]AVP56933.1 hypothetical protein C7H73_04140 [Pulveribacter suum]
MSKDESSPPPTSSTRGLLSKVVRFVRNPTVNWSELDAMDEERESQYSKQMLKEMIERKRRNDFVRRREFDYLRKLRRSEGVRAERPEDAGARTSAFQTSMTSPDERADTLRKIDEIEAQMSQQWWKGKGAPPGQTAMAPPPPAAHTAPAPEPRITADQPAPASAAMASALAGSPFAGGEHARAFEPTAPMGIPAPVVPAPAAAPAMVEPLFPPAVAPAPAPVPAPAARPAAVREKFVHDPDLEEAAIRFANADYDGAEAALQDVLAQRGGTPAAEQEHIWYTLFDLYRATGRHEQFEALSIEYAARFGRSAPLWFSIPLQLGLQVDVATAGAAAQQRELTWNAPPLLTLQSIAALQASLARAAPPWTLTWSRLTGIEPAAVSALAELLERWAGQDVQLRFIGVPALRALVQTQTPSGDRSRDPQWWRLRMGLLRLMGWADEFELAALDYCVTYEISPPSWTPPRCSFSGDADAPAVPEGEGAPPRDAPDSDLYMTSGFALSQPGGLDEPPLPALVGHIEGDASAALQALQSFARPGAPLVVECGQLIRIDFAAVGGVLNWAAAQQAAGQELEFRRVHRLVAVFFNVIGVSEHAWIAPRQD